MDAEHTTDISITCPHCGHVTHDDWECLGRNSCSGMLCESCGKAFTVMISECLLCGEETVFNWRVMPAVEARYLLDCEHCAQPLYGLEDAGVTKSGSDR